MQMIKEWLKRGLILPAIVGCVLSIPITAAQAALVTYSYSFTGNVGGDPRVPVHGSFQFDNSAGESGGTYIGAVKALSLTIGSGATSYTAVLAPGANGITISPNRWTLVSAATGPTVPGTDITPFNFDLRVNQIGGGLNTNLQGPPSFDVLKGDSARWRLFLEDADENPSFIFGSITKLTAVPLPAAVLLFGAGLISLVGLGAGGLRNLRGSRA